ncbi:hypothetical protein ACFGVR_17345 [Mucilaginibacter sp. AW1-3]
MLNRFTAILLIVFTLSANFSTLFVFAGFEINKTAIASTLCENRSRPWMHCNGKCYLLKKIKQAEQKEKNDERQMGKSLFQEAFFDKGLTITFNTQLLGVMDTPYPRFALPQRASVIFQPPKIG